VEPYEKNNIIFIFMYGFAFRRWQNTDCSNGACSKTLPSKKTGGQVSRGWQKKWGNACSGYYCIACI